MISLFVVAAFLEYVSAAAVPYNTSPNPNPYYYQQYHNQVYNGAQEDVYDSTDPYLYPNYYDVVLGGSSNTGQTYQQWLQQYQNQQNNPATPVIATQPSSLDQEVEAAGEAALTTASATLTSTVWVFIKEGRTFTKTFTSLPPAVTTQVIATETTTIATASYATDDDLDSSSSVASVSSSSSSIDPYTDATTVTVYRPRYYPVTETLTKTYIRTRPPIVLTSISTATLTSIAVTTTTDVVTTTVMQNAALTPSQKRSYCRKVRKDILDRLTRSCALQYIDPAEVELVLPSELYPNSNGYYGYVAGSQNFYAGSGDPNQLGLLQQSCLADVIQARDALDPSQQGKLFHAILAYHCTKPDSTTASSSTTDPTNTSSSGEPNVTYLTTTITAEGLIPQVVTLTVPAFTKPRLTTSCTTIGATTITYTPPVGPIRTVTYPLPSSSSLIIVTTSASENAIATTSSTIDDDGCPCNLTQEQASNFGRRTVWGFYGGASFTARAGALTTTTTTLTSYI